MNYSIVGAGNMGRRHIHAANKVGLELVGVADPSEEALMKVKKEHSLGHNLLYKGIDELFEQIIPDCIIIATTADYHCELTCKAAKSGVKYILVEKPMATSIAECKLMIDTCNQHGCLLSINHQMRFLDQYMIPKTYLDSSAFGGLKSMTVIAGNFGLAMNGTHYLEAFRFMTDENPAEVTAWFDDEIVKNPRGEKYKDRSGAIRVLSESGKRLYMEFSSDQGHGLEVIYAARNGHIQVSEIYGELVSTVREKEFTDLPTTRYGMPAIRERINIAPVEVIESSASVIQALLDDSNRVTGEQAMMAVKTIAAAYQSAENSSKPIRLADELDINRKFPWA